MSHFSCAVLLPPVDGTVSGDDALRTALLPYMENCCEEPPLEFMEFHEDEDGDVDERTGRRGYWENPNARWDWYAIGGRWRGMLRLRDGSRADVAVVGEVVTDADRGAYARALDEFGRFLRGEEVQDYELTGYRREYVVERYADAEFFARYKSWFWTHAVVTPDGEWHEVGKMGWWGVSSESGEQLRDWVDHYRERFVSPYMSHTIVIVDCHI